MNKKSITNPSSKNLFVSFVSSLHYLFFTIGQAFWEAEDAIQWSIQKDSLNFEKKP